MYFLSSTCQGLLALVFAGACVSKVRTAASFAAFSDTVVTLGGRGAWSAGWRRESSPWKP
ncbi:hypothetical protein ACWC4C_44330 [Streptomyces olivaceoviridis]